MRDRPFPFSRGTATLAAVKSANLTLRLGAARLRATVDWPRTGGTGLALVLIDRPDLVKPLLIDRVVVALLGPRSFDAELGALEWLAEHGPELGPSTGGVVLVGGARAARLAAVVRDNGWPRLDRQVLVHPRFTPEDPTPSSLKGVAPATVVHSDDSRDDGRRYAAHLRGAGVQVIEVRG